MRPNQVRKTFGSSRRTRTGHFPFGCSHAMAPRLNSSVRAAARHAVQTILVPFELINPRLLDVCCQRQKSRRGEPSARKRPGQEPETHGRTLGHWRTVPRGTRQNRGRTGKDSPAERRHQSARCPPVKTYPEFHEVAEWSFPNHLTAAPPAEAELSDRASQFLGARPPNQTTVLRQCYSPSKTRPGVRRRDWRIHLRIDGGYRDNRPPGAGETERGHPGYGRESRAAHPALRPTTSG